jgi:mgtE-like transporter
MSERDRTPSLIGRLGSLLGVGAVGVRQSFVALAVAAVAALVAGITLGALDERLEDTPGLLVLVPAAIAARGNVFGALGARLSTSIHAGTFSLSRRLDTFVGQNVAASMSLTLGLSVVLAVLAKGVTIAFGVRSVSLADFLVISLVGGVLASLVAVVITLALAAGSVRFGWDLDNVTAPLVTATGDVVTVPALFGATLLVGIDGVTPILAVVLTVLSLGAFALSWRSELTILHRILRESAPVLVAASLLSLVAGISLERRLETFTGFETLIVLIPGYLASAGALGGILSNRLSTKMMLGLAPAANRPDRSVREDFVTVAALAVPIFVLNGLLSGATVWLGLGTPGMARMVGVALLGGLIATVFVVAVAYYTTVAAVRFGLDPDTYGIPMVTSSLDLVGAFTLIAAIVALGIT